MENLALNDILMGLLQVMELELSALETLDHMHI